MLILQTLAYNAGLLVVTRLAIRRMAARRTVGAGLTALALLGTAALLLAVLLTFERFSAMRLFAWGLFGHGTAVALFGAVTLRRLAARALGLGLAVALAAIATFAFAVEPFRLETTTLRFESSKVSRPVRIALIADLQTDQIGDYEREVFEATMASAPDLILMSGDYLQADRERRPRLRAELQQLLGDLGFDAPLGVIAVAGNVDPEDWPESFAGLAVRSVEKTRRFELDLGEGGTMTVTALGLWDSFDPELDVESAPGFHVVVGHAPDYALGDINADLLLAGHTHGGQVRLPFVGPLLTLSRVPRSWAAGLTELDASRRLVVSRGIGMERAGAPRLRFLCRPELVILDLVPPAG